MVKDANTADKNRLVCNDALCKMVEQLDVYTSTNCARTANFMLSVFSILAFIGSK